MRNQLGFTPVEIAIVLFIVGLLLGGLLKGQELIKAARVSNIAAQLDEVKVAYLGFLDRYRSYPGDMPTAQAMVQIPARVVGCAAVGTCGNGPIDPNENILVWYHLSRAGFISGSYTGVTDAGAAIQNPTSADSPSNRYGGFLVLVNDNDYGDINAVKAGPEPQDGWTHAGGVDRRTRPQAGRRPARHRLVQNWHCLRWC